LRSKNAIDGTFVLKTDRGASTSLQILKMISVKLGVTEGFFSEEGKWK
jgi:hypothetical protein